MKKLSALSLTIPGNDGDVTIDYPAGFEFTDLGSVVSRAIPFVFAIAGVGLLIMIIASGMKLLTSAGDAKKMEEGKQTLTYAVIGFIVIFVAYWVVQIMGIMLGIDFGSIFK